MYFSAVLTVSLATAALAANNGVTNPHAWAPQMVKREPIRYSEPVVRKRSEHRYLTNATQGEFDVLLVAREQFMT